TTVSILPAGGVTLRDGCRGRVRRRALLASGIHSPHEIMVSGSAADFVINVSWGGHGSQRSERPVGLATVDVVAGHGYAGFGGGRVPLQENGVRLSVGPHPKQDCAHDPKEKDRQNRQRQA